MRVRRGVGGCDASVCRSQIGSARVSAPNVGGGGRAPLPLPIAPERAERES